MPGRPSSTTCIGWGAAGLPPSPAVSAAATGVGGADGMPAEGWTLAVDVAGAAGSVAGMGGGGGGGVTDAEGGGAVGALPPKIAPRPQHAMQEADSTAAVTPPINTHLFDVVIVTCSPRPSSRISITTIRETTVLLTVADHHACEVRAPARAQRSRRRGAAQVTRPAPAALERNRIRAASLTRG